MPENALFNEDKLTELHQIANGNMDFLNKIATTYIQQFEAKYPELKAAAELKDYERVEQLAHLLKGASYSVGLEQTALLFHDLEVAGENAHLDGADETLATIESHSKRFLAEWTNHFEQLT
ncbi:Hpt domain-containing protein [Exiguobacterium marinum]|uniref:Hpt domain-containing protein n=1 Tax=Exiguobacterium marinum TaxID=273528 RepID=A0ABY7X5H4_9BACL|nr:Hpt domain-containing protein [Exiguobacterium marinum]WDH77343.1 Hpt domain-containing protein [Exiguobacterium marinum]